MRRSTVGRARRQQIAREARQFYPVAITQGLTVDQIQGELLSRFPGELAPGEARMHAMGWTTRTVRDGLLALADVEDDTVAGLELIDVSRWLRGEVRPTAWLPRLCRLFRCHQAHLGWPPQGNEVPVDFSPEATAPAAHGVGHPIANGSSSGAHGVGLGSSASRPVGVEIHRDVDTPTAGGRSGWEADVAGLIWPMAEHAADVAHLGPALSAPELDENLVHGLTQLTHAYIQTQDRVVPHVLLAAVVQHLRTLLRLGDAGGRVDVRALAVQTMCLAGWLSFDIDNRGDAAWYWSSAARLAAEIGASSLHAYALGARTYLHPRPQPSTSRRSPEPAALLDRAIELAPATSKPGLLAWLHCRRAEEHALAGDGLGAMRHLEAAHHAAAMPGTDDSLLFLDDWHEGRMLRFEGSTAQLLGDHEAAIAVLDKSLRILPRQLLPQRAIVMVHLAIARAQHAVASRHDPDQACADLAAALDIARSARLLEVCARIAGARRYLDPWQDGPVVVDLDARLRDQSA